MTNIDIPIPGDIPRADWARSVAEALRENRVEAGPGIRVTRSPMGTVVEADSPASDVRQAISVSGESVVAMIISGGGSLEGYGIRCYPNFPDKTGSFGARLAVVEIALGAELPVGTYVIAHLAAMTKIGGGA